MLHKFIEFFLAKTKNGYSFCVFIEGKQVLLAFQTTKFSWKLEKNEEKNRSSRYKNGTLIALQLEHIFDCSHMSTAMDLRKDRFFKNKHSWKKMETWFQLLD